MKYFQSWQDFMREPANKALKESKGIHACKQKYIQEQNKMMWHDPMIIQENGGDAGLSLADTTTAAGGGGGSPLIFGHTAATTTMQWVTTMDQGFTASCNNAITVTPLAGYGGGTDFSFGSSDSRQKVLLAFVTGSKMQDLGGLSSTGYDCVVTASVTDALGLMAGNIVGATGSWSTIMAKAIADQGATAIVGGFTNTVAPSNLLSATTSSVDPNLTISYVTAGSVNGATEDFAAGTGSIAHSGGTDTYYADPGGQVFDGQVAPYTSFPRFYF